MHNYFALWRRLNSWEKLEKLENTLSPFDMMNSDAMDSTASVCNVIRRDSLVADMSLNLARLVKSRGGSIARRIPWSVSGRLYICSTNSIDRALTSGLHGADRETSRAARYFLRSPDKGSKKTERKMEAASERKLSGRERELSSPRCLEKCPS